LAGLCVPAGAVNGVNLPAPGLAPVNGRFNVAEQQLLDKATDIREGEELDVAVLKDYITAHLPNLNGDLSVKQFPSGFSNLTYLITLGDNKWVLRRPPFGTKAKSAHDMGREYRVLKALHQAFPYAPEPVLFCDDESVMGSEFYMMK